MTRETSNIYLDHNATTPIDPAVWSAMQPYLHDVFGNPASVEHSHGNAASIAVEHARNVVAKTIGAGPNEIVFTGSCTEANNLAILGTARANPEKRHLITSRIEHPAILEPLKLLERQGWSVTYTEVDESGRVSVGAITEAITDKTLLVSVMAANNEVGTLQPIKEIGSICAKRNVLFHSDLAQVAAHLDIDVVRDNIHLASLSAHKAYGPKGVGALYVRSRRPRVRIAPLIYGGGQERGLRPGTLNTAGIVGMGEALRIAKLKRNQDSERLRKLCNQFRDYLIDRIPGARLNGHGVDRIPNNISFSIEGVEPLALIRGLRDKISFSASSACTTDKIETSHVLLAMFGDSPRARQAFRIAPGRFTAPQDMAFAAEAIVTEARRLANMSRTAA